MSLSDEFEFDFVEQAINNGSNDSCLSSGLCYQVNASNWLGPLNMVSPIYGYIMPALISITIVANSLILVVLSRKHMASPTNIVLFGMALCDLITVVVPLPWYLYLFTYGNHSHVNWTALTCYMFEFMLETSPQIFHTATNWLTLALAVQRYIYVCHPAMAKQCCTNFRSKMLVWILVSVSCIHMVTRMFDRNYIIQTQDVDGISTSVCTVAFSHWLNIVTIDAYFLSFYWFRVLFVQLIPCFTLVIINTLLFQAMKRAERRRQKLMVGRVRSAISQHSSQSVEQPHGKETKRQRDANSTTLMLIIVIAAFLIVEVPVMVITALHTISSSLYEFMDYDVVKKITLMMNVVLCLSYPLNFAIYCGMSRQFRVTFRGLFYDPVLRVLSGGQLSRSDQHLGELTCRTRFQISPCTTIKKGDLLEATDASKLMKTAFRRDSEVEEIDRKSQRPRQDIACTAV